jgi:REP element-mobilizing transposase RayT
MANTYTQLNVQAVFSVKGRGFYLLESFRPELFEYMCGILKKTGQYPLAVNGYKDHVHIFFELHPANSVSSVLDVVKANSSRWINELRIFPGKFQWQKGYGAFTYSRSQRNGVIQYIINQNEHHKGKTFKEEYMQLLEVFEIDYNPDYLFEFYD